MKKFKTIFYDISGVCNAKCPYCMSGIHKATKGKFVTPDLFNRTLDSICNLDLLEKSGVIGLYNWGEPFLHPQLNELMSIINDHNLTYTFSTNAAKVPTINDIFVKNLKRIVFSMPGFSQKSYDRIHGLDFSKVVDNIRTIIEQCRNYGFKGSFSVSFHVYQFNLDEMGMCEEFANNLGILFNPCYAILNNWWQINALLDNTIEIGLLRKISEELFSFGLSEKIAKAPKKYRCPQLDLLAINERSDVLLCCQVPSTTDFSCGNLLSDDFSEILSYRYNNSICKDCIDKGLAYYFHNSLTRPAFYSNNKKSHIGTKSEIR